VLQLLANIAGGAYRCQAFLGVVIMFGEMLLHERVEQPAMVRVEGFLRDEKFAQGLGLVKYPRLHGGDELLARDEIHLHGEDAEEQIAIGGRLRHVLVLSRERRRWSLYWYHSRPRCVR
jgi:hypothetical protein